MYSLVEKNSAPWKVAIKAIFCAVTILTFPFTGNSQVIDLGCQDHTVGTVGIDRNDFNGGSTASSSQGSMHNFTFPMAEPCKRISQVTIDVDFINVDQSGLDPSCGVFAYFVNSSVGCPSFAPASCTNIIIPQPNYPPPVPPSVQITYTDPADASLPFGEVFGVDIVPAMFDVNCPNGQSTISSGDIILEYEICVSVTLVDENIDTPPDLGTTQTICPGETVELDPGTYTDYLWGPGGETSPTITVGQGNYSVTVTDANGCTGTDAVLINAFPLPTITFSPPMPIACDNGTSPVSVDENYTNYAWSNGDSGQNVDLVPGTYDVTVTDANNCTNVESITVINIVPPNAGSDNLLDVCNDGTLYNLDAVLLAHDTPGTWTDDNASGVDVNSDPFNVDFSGVAPGIYNFTYTVIGALPCPNDQATITVTVFEQNDAGTTATEQFCADPGDLDFNLLIGGPPTNGTWTDLNGSGVNLGNPFIVDMNGVPPGTYNYQYQLPANGPCPPQSETLTIIILDAADAGLDNAATVCEGALFDLQTLVNGANDTGIFVDIDASGALVGSTVITTGLAGQTFNFAFEVGSSGSPCGVDQAIFTLTIETSLSAGDDGNDTVCGGEEINLFDVITNEDVGGTFTDSNASGGLNGNLLDTENIAPGTYNYTYEVGDGVTCPVDMSTATITILENPTSTFSISDLVICEETCDSFDINLTGVGPYEFPLNVYSGTTGDLIVSEIFNSAEPSYTLIACNSADGNGFSNDTLNLLTDSLWFITIPSVSDANCLADAPANPDTIFINTVSNEFTVIDTSACISDTLDIGGVLFFDGNDTYSDTLAGVFCDSIVNVSVTFSDLDTLEFNPTLCAGDSILIQGVWFNETNTSLTTIIDNAVGCDTFITISVAFFAPADTLIDLDFCSGDSLVVNNVVYNESNPSGTEILENQSSNGCDSLVTINLEFTNDISIMIDDTLCMGEFVDIAGQVFDQLSPSGQVILTGTGCDTIIDIDLSFYMEADSLLDGQYCSDFSIMVNGTMYDQGNPSGIELLPNASQFGCDSIVNIDLDFFPEATNTFMMTICDNESIDINGTIYDSGNTNGVEILSGASSNGCDSTVNVQLDVLLTYSMSENETICEGDSIFLEGAWQFDPGTYVDSLLTVDLCDSIITTEVETISCAFIVNISAVDNVCFEGSTGSLTVDIQSVLTEDVTVSWVGENTGTTGSTMTVGLDGLVDITSLPSDNYTITITNNEGDVLFEVTVPVVDLNTAISGDWSVIDSIPCFGETGSIEIQPNGGQGPYNYNWDDSTIGDNPVATGIAAGTYSVTITDSNGCDFDTSFVLLDALEFSAGVTIMNLSCEDSNDGQISVIDIVGGQAPYSIFINGDEIDSTSVVGLNEGMYAIQVIDNNNCIIEFNEEIVSGSNPQIAMYVEDYTIMQGDSIAIQSTIIDGDFTFEWINNTDGLSCIDCSNPMASPNATTVYDLIIMDVNGCTQEVSLLVTVEEELIVDVVPNIFSPNGDNQNDEFTFISNEKPTLSVSMKIFDRWGSLMFNSQALGNTISWNGFSGNQQLVNGVYVYEIIIQYEDGTSKVRYGDVVLIN